ncbi:hypothetical protein SAMN05421664_1315 [Chryseobacterium soldanellicola]|uniref:Uncharacterized protein n=1 Tax=Chryseobacterium soldanellicola TaxID=311333 RepID=A0A1H1A8V9_9FLAO|nr:hypothetical protein [Chryseobacterium soldanellicola]SDQ36165.1 hypothetical protein SAMN05421664_1315 [Chryseobacterium soldanellicola]
MKKTVYLCVAGLCSVFAHAQVGIRTSTPNSTLDINGKTTLRKELRVGGTSSQVGNAGQNGQVLVSQGEGLPPVWKSLNVTFLEEGQYRLINSYLSSDQTGISALSNGVAGDNVLKNSIGDQLTDQTKGKWSKISGLENNFTVKETKNKLTYQFQTGVEMKSTSATTSQNISFACGIFRNGRLVAVRPDEIITTNNTDKQGIQDYIFTLNYSEQDVPVGVQKVEVACRKIEASNNNAQFTIGRNVSNTNNVSNAFTLESIVKIDLIEYITYKTN